MSYSVIHRQDIIINLSDDSSILIDPRYLSETLVHLFVYYQAADQDIPSFVSSCEYEKDTGVYYVPFYYSNFDLMVYTDIDDTIVLEEVDKTNVQTS